MTRILLVLTLLLVPALPASATFSIVAIDPITGDLGIAVASRYFAVGAVVPWADAGVGAVATQASVNVGDHADPMGELRRLMNLQMTINHGGAVNRALTANDFAKAQASAEKLVGYSPLDPATHVRAGFIAYLAGNRDRATAAFARARQLTLPAQFKTLWDGQSSRIPAFARVLEDKAFVATIFPPQ